jgi:Trypsin
MKVFSNAWLATCLLAAAFIFEGGMGYGPLKHIFEVNKAPKAEFNPITPERKATHMITYLDKEGEEVAGCTGTAVGPHALLTAVHCDEGTYDSIRLDLSQHVYHIIGAVADGRDAIIYHLDGPEFKNYVTIKEREAKLGEEVISYGDGHRDYPQHTYVGHVVADVNGGDVSELDIADGTHCFDIPVIPGDSGSAIYAKDGSIVAIVTFGDVERGAAIGFALAFTPEQLEQIKK